MLALTTTSCRSLYAVPLGVLAAWKARGADRPRRDVGLSVLGFSIPVFVIGYALIYVFSLKLRWLPVQGYKPLSAGLWRLPAQPGAAEHRAGPRVRRAGRARHARRDARDPRPRTTCAPRAPRAPARRACCCLHALKNAGVPVVTVIGIGFASLIGGVVVTESVFNIPGIGRLTVDAILHRDYPIVQGVMLVFSALLIASTCWST